jgi:MSHA pilin protein MshD
MKERGVTLIELVITITLIGIAVSAVLGTLAANAKSSADGMVRAQAMAIADAYLEEIRLKSFTDPDGVDGETGRLNFDDVDDYNGLSDVGAVDQFGNAIAGLGEYRVAVAVAHSSALIGVGSANALRIDVTVTYPAAGVDVRVTGYRANYR